MRRCSLWAALENSTLFTRGFAPSSLLSPAPHASYSYVTALLFLSIDKLARVPVPNSPLSRVLRRYKVSPVQLFCNHCAVLPRITQVQQVCNITSFCGVSLFDLANRHLVASPELARARAAVLEYLRTPSSDTDDDAVDFNIGAPPESQNPSPNPEP